MHSSKRISILRGGSLPVLKKSKSKESNLSNLYEDEEDDTQSECTSSEPDVSLHKRSQTVSLDHRTSPRENISKSNDASRRKNRRSLFLPSKSIKKDTKL